MKSLKLEFLDQYRDFGLLVMRIGLGAVYIGHGWPKMVGGPDKWAGYGARLESITGIGFWPEFWGFMAAFAEMGGGILLILGLLTRPAALLLIITMIVASLSHYVGGDGFSGYAHSLKMAFTFFGIFFLGAGKYSVDAHLK